MNSKTFTIGCLSVSAVVLLAANLIQPRNAEASLVVKDNEYTAVTARISKGGEALYILDNRSGKMVALTYDPSKRAVVAIGKPKSLTEAFPGGK